MNVTALTHDTSARTVTGVPSAETTTGLPHTHQRTAYLGIFYLCAVAVVMLLLSSAAQGQSTRKKEPPKPRQETLKTKDGVKLRAFYFPSDQKKEAIPVLLIHDWESQASPYALLLKALRDAGCAVLALDYRGHGGSREYIDQRGNVKEFDTTTMGKADVANIIRYDLEAAKKFLEKENNAGLLNLNALVLIGVREGCVIAANWADRDWKWPSVGAQKQGQDVKALVMISPTKLVKGVAIDPVIARGPVPMLPMLFIDGSESPDAADASRIIKRLEAFKKRMGQGQALGLEVKLAKTKLYGARLLKASPKLMTDIKNFILDQVKISDDENPWVERVN